MATINLTTNTFDETIGGSSLPIVVDFWAEWCGPCKQVAPILDQIAEEHSGEITIAKLNVDEHPDIAMRYQVMSIPTMLLFKDGQLADTIVGLAAKEDIARMIDKHL